MDTERMNESIESNMNESNESNRRRACRACRLLVSFSNFHAARAPPAAREPATPKNYRHNFDSLPSPKAKHDNECWQ